MSEYYEVKGAHGELYDLLMISLSTTNNLILLQDSQ